MATVYTYTETGVKYRLIDGLCDSLGIDCERITQKDIGLTVAQLITRKPGEIKKSVLKIPPMYMQPELLIMKDFSSEKMDEFFEAYKNNQIEPIFLKAIVTPFNANWTIFDLTKELIKERNSMRDIL